MAVAVVGITVLCGRPLELVIGTLLGFTIGFFGMSALMPKRYFEITELDIKGPAVFGWQMISIPKIDIELESLKRSAWDKLSGVLKIRGRNGQTIVIGPIDFTNKQRSAIYAMLNSLVNGQLTKDGSGQKTAN